MYKVDVIKLRNKLDELNNLLENYQENYMNMYYQIEISDQEEYWYDPHAKDFFDDKYMEKNNIEESYEELNEIYTLILDIIEMYSSLGGVVEFDLSYRTSILSKFNIYKNKLNRILNSYNDLDYGFASSDIVNSIGNQISNVRKQIFLADILKENVRNIMDDIKEFESDISRMIKRIYISKLQFVDVEKYCTSNDKEQSDKSVINPEEIGNITKKMTLYNDLEESNFILILNNFKKVIEAYKTTNTPAFENLKESVNNKFESIKDINMNNIDIYKRNVEKYEKIDEEVTNDARNIGA